MTEVLVSVVDDIIVVSAAFLFVTGVLVVEEILRQITSAVLCSSQL